MSLEDTIVPNQFFFKRLKKIFWKLYIIIAELPSLMNMRYMYLTNTWL